jgi:protein-disulfide isomerase
MTKAKSLLGHISEIFMYSVLCLVFASIAYQFVSPKAYAKASVNAVLARGTDDSKLMQSYLRQAVVKPTIIEFMDFQCPPCRASVSTIDGIRKRHANVDFVAVNFPLRIHPLAENAAVAAEVARSAGYYDRAFHDLYSGRVKLDTDGLNKYLTINGCKPVIGTTGDLVFRDKVRRQVSLANTLNVHATPTFFILGTDGRLTEYHSFDLLEKNLK